MQQSGHTICSTWHMWWPPSWITWKHQHDRLVSLGSTVGGWESSRHTANTQALRVRTQASRLVSHVLSKKIQASKAGRIIYCSNAGVPEPEQLPQDLRLQLPPHPAWLLRQACQQPGTCFRQHLQSCNCWSSSCFESIGRLVARDRAAYHRAASKCMALSTGRRAGVISKAPDVSR